MQLKHCGPNGKAIPPYTVGLACALLLICLLVSAKLDTSSVRVSSVAAEDRLVSMTLLWPSVADVNSYELKLTLHKVGYKWFNATATVSVVFLQGR